MDQHPEIAQLIHEFNNKQLHAANSGRKLMTALVQVAVDSKAESANDLFIEIQDAMTAVLQVMPAYAPPLNVMHIIMVEVEEMVNSGRSCGEIKLILTNIEKQYINWSVDAKTKISNYAINLIPNDAKIFTFTLSETVLYSLRQLWEKGKRFSVFVTESRPNNDGLITAARLSEAGIAVEYGVDACMTEFISQSDLFISGTEAVLENGNVICKVGTHLAAMVAHEYKIPLYVLVDTMKFNVSSRVGINLAIDNISENDLGLQGNDLPFVVGGHLFDETPNMLIRSIVTEHGVISPQYCSDYMRKMKMSHRINDMIQKHKRSN